MATILAVDDEQSIRDILKMALEDEGHEVTLADGGRQAQDCISKKSYNLIITDLIMPDIDGIAIIKFALKKNPNTRMITITGGGKTDTEHYVKLAAELGVRKIVHKPFDLDQIIDAVNDVLGGQ